MPWQGDESHTYTVKNDGKEVGRSVLSIDVQGAQTVLSQKFTGETSDESAVTVDSKTLKPISARREIIAKDDDVVIETTYTETGASIKQGDKQSGLSVPEHSYDNDTSLFLWRTLPFEVGWEGSYTTIITNRRSRQKVNLAVVRRESVTLASGEFPAWRLEIKTSNATQTAWYTDTPRRELLRYDNDRGVIYELDTAPTTA
ncbi:MAG: DUF3108 domain-containing protein [Dehalococcoidia bacterium]